jgi:hypothetical protein
VKSNLAAIHRLQFTRYYIYALNIFIWF